MKYYGILFTDAMVRAILAGRKTQTRRTHAPKYSIGDRLWVRETWLILEFEHMNEGQKYVYRADMNPESDKIRKEFIAAGYRYQWRPSIHMPRSASRITLEVLDIREQQLQDISEEDADAEGLDYLQQCEGWHVPNDNFFYLGEGEYDCTCGDYHVQELFGFLWDSIYAKDGIPWASNPTVWATTFRRIEE
jgi:hypothetical protein